MTTETERPPEPAEPRPSRVGVVIVTRRRRANLERCLEGLQGGFSVVVVDNGSFDSAGFENRFPSVRFVRLPRDFGFTKALNIGIRAMEADQILLLSPDVEIQPGTIREMADCLESEAAVGAVCPHLRDQAGSAMPQVSTLPTPSLPDPAITAGTPGERVPCASTQAMMLRSFFLRALRQIDERYGDYGSHLEICRQVLRANKAVLIHPTATAVLYSGSGKTRAEEDADRELGTGAYLRKHAGMVAGSAYLLKRIAVASVRLRMKKAWLLVSQTKVDGSA